MFDFVTLEQVHLLHERSLLEHDAMIAIATHELDKAGLAALLRQLFGQ